MSAGTSLASTSSPTRSRSSRMASSRSTSRASRNWSCANVSAGRLHFTTDIAEAVKDASIVMIAVGTPTRQLDGNADLQYVYAAAEEIAPRARPLCGDRHQVDRSGRHRLSGQAHRRRSQSRTPIRRRVQPGIPAGRQRDLRLRHARSHRDRHRERCGPRAAGGTLPSVHRKRRRADPTPTSSRRSSSNTRPTRSSPPRSASSTRWPTSAKRSAAMSSTCRAAWAATSASATPS